MAHSTDQKRDDGGADPANIRSTGAIDMSSQEAVDGNVPFPAELHPVCAIPPVAVEVSIAEPGDLSEGAEDVFKDDEENE